MNQLYKCKNYLIIRLKTIYSLGFIDIFRVILYKTLINLSIHKVCSIEASLPKGPFFEKSTTKKKFHAGISNWHCDSILFSYFRIPFGDNPPDWLVNPIETSKERVSLVPWWKIPDFDDAIGDIKNIWELSRFNWVIAFAQRAQKGDLHSLKRLNLWLSDWIKSNPPYLGPNWKCGQEASIRVIHLCVAALIMGQERKTSSGLKEFIKLHLQRIEPTLHYAIAQNNNHGISEAAALFIGGSWLLNEGDPDSIKYQKLGRRWIENRVQKLIDDDGSFSQYSVNYHRMMLDTLSIAEVWRQNIGLESFSLEFYRKSALATSWLYQMVCKKCGDAPNLGANDGTLILQLTDSPYRDFRPSVQLASGLFKNCLAYQKKGFWDEHMTWLGVSKMEVNSEPYVNCDYNDGGYKILRFGCAKAIFKFPKYRFRPSQADALHVDLWVNEANFLSDSGSYSYNSISNCLNYFNGTASHNTVQFDDRDQMPRIGRFLFGNWLKTKNVSNINLTSSQASCTASYRDHKGAEHLRQVILKNTCLNICDKVRGFKKKAVLRWRLSDDEWILKNIKNGLEVSNGVNILTVTSDVPFIKFGIVDGWKSLHYMQKQKVPILEIEVGSAGKIVSEFMWPL